MHMAILGRQEIMIRFYLVPVIGISVLFSACSNPIASNPDSSTSEPSDVQQTDKTESTTQKTTKSIKSALDKAQSATEKASQSVHSALEQANKTAQSASQVVEDIITVKTQLKEMSTDAGNTLTAVHSKDFKTAQQEFAQLQGNWGKIKNTVKKSSPKAYQEINVHLITIDNLLKQPNRDHTELAKQLSSFTDKNLTLLNIYSKDNQ